MSVLAQAAGQLLSICNRMFMPDDGTGEPARQFLGNAHPIGRTIAAASITAQPAQPRPRPDGPTYDRRAARETTTGSDQPTSTPLVPRRVTSTPLPWRCGVAYTPGTIGPYWR